MGLTLAVIPGSRSTGQGRPASHSLHSEHCDALAPAMVSHALESKSGATRRHDRHAQTIQGASRWRSKLAEKKTTTKALGYSWFMAVAI